MDSKLTRRTKGRKEKTPHQQRHKSRDKVAKTIRRLKRHVLRSRTKKASLKAHTSSERREKAEWLMLDSKCSEEGKVTMRLKRRLPESSSQKASPEAHAPSKEVKKDVGAASPPAETMGRAGPETSEISGGVIKTEKCPTV